MDNNDYSSEDVRFASIYEDVTKDERHLIKNFMSTISLSDISEEDFEYIEEELEKIS